MPTIEDLVDSIPISFDLTLDAFGKVISPSRTLLSEEILKLNRWRPTRVLKELEACHASVSVEDYEFIIVGADQGELVNLLSIYNVLREIAHVLFALFEEPSNSRRFVLKFAVAVIGPIYFERAK